MGSQSEEMPTRAQIAELAAPFIGCWMRKNRRHRMNMSNGRGDLLDHVKNFYAANSKPSKTDADAQRSGM
jgi:hypothetical protein